MSHPTSLPLSAQELIRLTPLSPAAVRKRIANFIAVFSTQTGVTAKRPLEVLASILTHSTSEEADGFCWPGSTRLYTLVGCSYSVFRASRTRLYDTGRVRRETRVIADGTSRKGYVIDGWDDVHDDHFGNAVAPLEIHRRAQNSELRTQDSPDQKALTPIAAEEAVQGPGDPILDSDIEQSHGEVEETFLLISQEYGCYRGWALKYALRLPPNVSKHTLLCWKARAEIERCRGQRAFWMSCVKLGYSEFSEKDHVRIRERRLVEDWEAASGDVMAIPDHPRDKYFRLPVERQERVRRWVCKRHDATTKTGRAVRARMGLDEQDWAVVGEAMNALSL